MTQPTVYMIAGPNGAGKTTAAMTLLPNFLSVHEFVNADEIARGLNPLNPDGQAVPAGRLMLQRIDDLIASGKSFAFETTGASRVFAEKLRQAKSAGSRLSLVYLWLPNAELAKTRVRLRVAQGGHDIPGKDIERRYGRGLKNLVDVYLPLVDEAYVYDNSASATDIQDLIAKKIDTTWAVVQDSKWQIMLKNGGGGDNERAE
ncbi:MAG: AAA family ATPase [Alphaproteobacteria bacterium]|nr:AAA family ATPase [Alphaproteobacteria bacterium]